MAGFLAASGQKRHKVVPSAFVSTSPPKNCEARNRCRNFRKIRAVQTNEGRGPLNRWHPHIVEYDIAIWFADQRCQRKINQYRIECVISVDENYTESLLLSGKPRESLDRSFLAELEYAGLSAENLLTGDADATPPLVLKGINGDVVAPSIGLNRGKEIDGRKAIGQTNFQGNFRFGVTDKSVNQHPLLRLEAGKRIMHGVYFPITPKLRITVIHGAQYVDKWLSDGSDRFAWRGLWHTPPTSKPSE